MLEVTEKQAGKITHVWIHLDNKIEIEKSYDHVFYHTFFWEEAYDIDERGYFCEGTSTVTCHTSVDKALLNKIEKKLDKEGLIALYFKGRVRELQIA